MTLDYLIDFLYSSVSPLFMTLDYLIDFLYSSVSPLFLTCDEEVLVAICILLLAFY